MSNKRPRTEASEGEILRAKNTIKDKLKKFKYVEKESYTESFESLQKEPFQSDIENQKIFKPNEFLNDVRIDDVSSDSSSKDQKSELDGTKHHNPLKAIIFNEDNIKMNKMKKSSTIKKKASDWTKSGDHQNSSSSEDQLTLSKKITAAPNISHDIGNYIGNKINDSIKKQLLQSPWIPPKNYEFPHSIQIKNGIEGKRYASQSHLDQFSWLVLSDVKKGYFCKYCVLFVNIGSNHTNVHVKKLVVEPLTNFSKLFGKEGALTNHDTRDYHKYAVEAAKKFLRFSENPNLDIINQVNEERMNQVKENRSRLKPIIETVIFLGRQNIAFRGHRDDGPLNIDSPINEGNFRELLKFRMQSGDLQLKIHLDNSSSRATYISKTTQNDLINCCGDHILSVIINRIKEARFYSIMFDETTDIAHISQMTFVIRYVYQKKIREDFLKFIDIHDKLLKMNNIDNSSEIKATGLNLGQIALSTIAELNLNPKDCVGVTTDGCSVMVSDSRGAVITVQKEATNAVYSPCFNHILNLSISKASSVQSVRNAIGTMKEIIAFFNASAKRSATLKSVMGHKLSHLCETRWIERHDGVLQFRETLPRIYDSLDLISTWSDISTAAKAKTLKLVVCESNFLVTVVCLSDLLSCTQPLSRYFQKIQIDLKSARDLYEDTLKVLYRKREKCEVKFSSLFEEICNIADELGTEVKVPRLTNRQTNRPNYPCDNAIDYYRRSIYIPIVESVIEDLKSRFPEETLNLFNLFILFPNSARDKQSTENAVWYLAEKYCVLFNTSKESLHRILIAELEFWEAKCEREKVDPSYDSIKLLELCDKDIYPTIYVLLKILITLPLSAASAERSFSTLRRIKTWLRSSMVEDRLVGLALMNIHNDIEINTDSVIDRYAKIKKHRLEFVL